MPLNKKANLILRYSILGIAFALLVFVLGAGFVYANANIIARQKVDLAVSQVELYSDMGLQSLDYKQTKLESDKKDLNKFLGYSDLLEIQDYAEQTLQNIENDYYNELRQKESLFELDFESFKKDFIDSDSISIENRDEYEIKKLEFSEKVTQDYTSLLEIEKDLEMLSKVHNNFLSEIESSQKEMLKQNLIELNKESEELLSFFKKRGGYDNEIKKLGEYKVKANDLITLEKYEDYSFDELNRVYQEQVYPLINGPKEKMLKISAEEEAKRASWVKAEKEKWEKLGRKPPEAPFEDEFKQIYINIASQYMYAYEDGKLVMSTPITSGMRGYETVRGKFAIYHKSTNRHLRSPFPNVEYDVIVDYWMPFYSGYGIHDSCNSHNCWRSVFGGSDYIWSGSHGCVNTPHDKVSFLYGWAEIGTTVYVD